MTKREAVIEAARALCNVPLVQFKYQGVASFVVPSAEFFALGVAINEFDRFRAAQLAAKGINADGSTRE